MPNITPQQLREMRMPLYRSIVHRMWQFLWIGLVGFALTFLILSFTDLPDTEELENPRSELASEVIGSNDDVLGRFFIENRVPVDFDQLSPYVEQALVATEDERFYSHSGIDFQALGRVFFKTILMGDASSGGASTITQQLAKLLFTGKKGSGLKRVIQKLKEWIIAVRLERNYTKEEIIAMYLNKFDFLYDSYGIKAAAETYFGKTQDSLNIQESAMLVGMLKNPSLYNPKRKEALAKQRRSVVLDQMRKNGILTNEQYDTLKNTPVDLSKFRRKSHTQGLAQYFRSELAKILQDEILPGDDARKKPDGSPYNIYKDGLKIYTTIDPLIQKHAEDAMYVHMKALQGRFWKLWERKQISPWDFKTNETTEGELRYRKWKLNQMVRESERYAIMRDRFIGTLEQDLEKEIDGLRLGDNAIENMIAWESEKDEKKNPTAAQRAVLSSDRWQELKKQWKALQRAATAEFNKKTKMIVFDYNDRMEKDTVMSPLDSLKYHHCFMQIGSLAIEPKTGHIKAWVGGVNHKYFSFDHTRTNRQVGSTFKPFIYATAIAQQGVSPCLQVTDLPRTIFPGDGKFNLIKAWTPQNATGKYTGRSMRLRSALKNSVNTVSVFLMQQLGSVEPVIELLGNMGVDTKKIPKQPSICLGAADMTVYDMAGAYTTFANNGYYSKPIFITRIEDKNGRVIYMDEEVERQALQEEPNYVMVEMLKYAGGNLGLRSESGGKTGTTNDYVDGWFMGITPTLVVGTWVGGEDRWVRFLSLAEGQGSRMAKPFCKEFLKRVENDPQADFDSKTPFPRPGGDLSIGLDCNDYSNRGDDDEYDEEEEEEEEGGSSGSGLYEDPFGTGGSIKQDSLKKKKNIVENEDFDGGR
jgi:penicillin-binding protein 1A